MENTIFERATEVRRWIRTRQFAAIHLMCLLGGFITQRRFQYKRVNLPTREMRLHRQNVREEILNNLASSGKARKIIRMNMSAFMKLCNILVQHGGLLPTKRMSVEEQVARFLHIVGNDLRNRMISWVYRRSESSTSRSFHRVLRAIINLEDRYLQQPTGQTIAKEIREKRRFYPYFQVYKCMRMYYFIDLINYLIHCTCQDCVGAIDGTHVRVKVSTKNAPRYRGRKGYPTINVLAACTFDLKFTYVLTGWEGTASDSRIVKDALVRDDKLIIPDGNIFSK